MPASNILSSILVFGLTVLGTTPEFARAAAPALELQRDGAGLRVTFTGSLQSAPSPLGPWETLTNVTSPYVLPGATLPSSGYFRALAAASAEGLFDATDPAELTVRGPLQTHFELAYAGLPDGIFPPKRTKPYFDGFVRFGATEVPASLRVRGNSSLQECPFPKLKFKVAKEHRTNTPFAEAREVRIGTHCAEGGRGPVGRLREEAATYREALAYEVMGLLGFVAPRVRRAQIEYQDTSPAGEGNSGGWQLSRQAMLLEDAEVLAARLGGRALNDEEIAGLTNVVFDAQLVTDLRLFHVLLGNWDFELSTDGRGLWNTDVLELAGGQWLLVPGDFDLASFVTGTVRVNAPHDFHPELPDLERETLYQVEQVRGRVGEERFQAGKQRFEARRVAVDSHIADALIDEPGRTNALHQVAVFYDALATMTTLAR